jgi:hypothetical protein
MLADPPSVYSVVFNPANFLVTDDGNISNAILNGSNNFNGLNKFNNNLVIESTNISVGSSADVTFQAPNARLMYMYNTTIAAQKIDNAVNLVGGTKTALTYLNSDRIKRIGPPGVDLYHINKIKYAYEYVSDPLFSGAWSIPGGGTCPYIQYSASTLPNFIYVEGIANEQKCIWVPAAGQVAEGTVFRVICKTNTAGATPGTNVIWLSVNGSSQSTNSTADGVFGWFNVVSLVGMQTRLVTTLRLGQSIAFISKKYGTRNLWTPLKLWPVGITSA